MIPSTITNFEGFIGALCMDCLRRLRAQLAQMIGMNRGFLPCASCQLKVLPFATDVKQ